MARISPEFPRVECPDNCADLLFRLLSRSKLAEIDQALQQLATNAEKQLKIIDIIAAVVGGERFEPQDAGALFQAYLRWLEQQTAQ